MSMEKWFLDLEKQTDKLSRTAEGNIGKQYGQMLREIRATIQKSYDRCAAVDGTLTYSEMSKYGRIDKLNVEVEAIARKYTGAAAGEIRSGLRKTITDSFTVSKLAIEEISERKINGLIKKETIDAILQNPISGLKLNVRLAARRAETVLKIKEEMTRGLVRGDRYKDIAKRLQDALEIDAGKANRIVRTESHRCMEAGKKESLDNASKQGVELKKWWKSSEDERVRTSHSYMGQKYSKENAIPYDEDFVNDETGGAGPHPGALGTPEDDINCRCTTIIEIVTN